MTKILERGTRVRWTGPNGQTLTGKVQYHYDDDVAIACDQVEHAAGVPIGRVEHARPDQVTVINEPDNRRGHNDD